MLEKIVSGGQTGVDRGALDAALNRGFPCGGWVPAGRRAEDGPIAGRYPVQEMTQTNYMARTRRNVAESDGTLIIAHQPLSGGTAATEAHARRRGRPCLTVDPSADSMSAADRIGAWLAENDIRILNVAGPRASTQPVIHGDAERIVGALIELVSSG